jgi:galactokinase
MPSSSLNPIVVRAPGRVNLLGEHTDYTGGLVLPMAVPFYTTAHIAANGETQNIFRSAQFEGEYAEPVGSSTERRHTWSDYPVGVLRQMQVLGIAPPAFLLELNGNVPLGAGLSSSASVEVVSCLAMLALSGEMLPANELALLCQRAENDFVGAPCGIMDQFVISAARAGHALLISTRDLKFEHVPMQAGGLREMSIVICNSRVKHSIAAGAYGERRQQVEAGQAVLGMHFSGLRDLGEATLEQLQACEQAMTRESFKRCRHIITENARVRRAREAMLAGDPRALGALMVEAHVSERDDFECSCDEIDFLVETAIGLRGCVGARLTGGGFVGCTVNLVTREAVDGFCETLKDAYRARFAVSAETYVCEAVDGALAEMYKQAEREREV